MYRWKPGGFRAMTPPTNREIDARIAEQVMGWKRVSHPMKLGKGKFFEHPIRCIEIENPILPGNLVGYRPSFSIADAFTVVEKMRQEGWHCQMQGWHPMWSVVFHHPGSWLVDAFEDSGHSESLPLAICQAALCAIKATEKKGVPHV